MSVMWSTLSDRRIAVVLRQYSTVAFCNDVPDPRAVGRDACEPPVRYGVRLVFIRFFNILNAEKTMTGVAFGLDLSGEESVIVR